MKKMIIIIPKLFFVFFCVSVSAQSEIDRSKLTNNAICILPGGPFEGYLYVPPEVNNLLAPSEKNLTISASYVPNGTAILDRNCINWPANAQAAFEHALSLWEPYLDSDHSITVRACWSDGLSGLSLGAATSFSYINTGFSNCWYPAPLAESIFNNPDIFSSNEILAVFNATLGSWYFGTDGLPGASEFDFVTVVLHEIGHGLGFSGMEGYDDGIDGGEPGDVECENIAGHGCLGAQISAMGQWYLSAFSKTVQTDNGTLIQNAANPSTNMATLLTGGSLSGMSGGLFLGGANLLAANSNSVAKLYTPSPFEPGSSYSHFDDATFPNELMQPILNSGQAIHTPGLAFHHLRDMGWSTSFLPVELIRFEAIAKGKEIELIWETATESNNQGFEIERSVDAQHWTSIDFVAGNGDRFYPSYYQFQDKTPLAGINYYRLIQIDWDGTFSKSKIVNAQVTAKENTITIFPNPINNEILLKANNSTILPLKYQIINGLGSIVDQGEINDDSFRIECAHWPGGVYTLVTADGQQLRLVKG